MTQKILLFAVFVMPVFVYAQRTWEPVSYTIEGIMLTMDGTPIPNDTFLLYNHNQKVITNADGKFSIEISISSGNDRGYKTRKHENMVNAKYLVFMYSTHYLAFVKNKWRKYINKEKPYMVKVYWPVFYMNKHQKS